jgi:hypothetical protein
VAIIAVTAIIAVIAVIRLGVAELTTSEAVVIPHHLHLAMLDIVPYFV